MNDKSDTMSGENPKFFTQHGEIHCVVEGGKKRFVFYNPNSVKNEETVAFLKLFVALANYLPEAQSAANKFLKLKESLPNESSDDVEAAFKVSKDESPPKKKRYILRQSVAEEEGQNKSDIYSKILQVYGKDPPIRVALVVNIFEGYPYIWLKRFWYTESDKVTSKPAWIHCFGAFRFSISDDAHAIYSFVKKCMLEEEEKAAEKKAAMKKKLENRNAYHDEAVYPPSPPAIVSEKKSGDAEATSLEGGPEKDGGSSEVYTQSLV